MAKETKQTVGVNVVVRFPVNETVRKAQLVQSATSLANEALTEKPSFEWTRPERKEVPRVVSTRAYPYREQLPSLTDDKGAKPVWKLIKEMYETGALRAGYAPDESSYDYDGSPDLSDDGFDLQGMEFDDLQRLAAETQRVIAERSKALKEQQASAEETPADEREAPSEASTPENKE